MSDHLIKNKISLRGNSIFSKPTELCTPSSNHFYRQIALKMSIEPICLSTMIEIKRSEI